MTSQLEAADRRGSIGIGVGLGLGWDGHDERLAFGNHYCNEEMNVSSRSAEMDISRSISLFSTPLETSFRVRISYPFAHVRYKCGPMLRTGKTSDLGELLRLFPRESSQIVQTMHELLLSSPFYTRC